MTKEEYIKNRNGNIGAILYEHYTEHAKGNLLDMGDFFMCFQQWPGSGWAVQNALMHYDAKFNIMVIPDGRGGVLRYE